MKKTSGKTTLTVLLLFFSFIIATCMMGCNAPNESASQKKQESTDSTSGYATINGLKMYYEIHGKGNPLVLIHGGGSTITTTFGKVLPLFAKSRQVIAVELQAHGHTADIDRPLSFEQDADDVAALLQQLHIKNADFFGFSNGGSTAMQIGIRHPDIVRKLVVASAFYKRDGAYPQLWTFMQQATLDNMPQQLKDAYLRINPDTKGLSAMHDKDRQRVLSFKDWPDSDIRSIKAPTMILIGDQDIVRPEHAVEMYRLLPHGRLAILPGGHGAYIGEITVAEKDSQLRTLTVAMIEAFLDSTQ
ncbi:alpha/beta hydrolase [Chitinophaga sp. MM2321]|uniref:alpha/beta fold hydrolase n=1 Tax=Chitinophaga sp. MM2321 TaxID=3137178 RepID=UPI0032D57CAD